MLFALGLVGLFACSHIYNYQTYGPNWYFYLEGVKFSILVSSNGCYMAMLVIIALLIVIPIIAGWLCVLIATFSICLAQLLIFGYGFTVYRAYHRAV